MFTPKTTPGNTRSRATADDIRKSLGITMLLIIATSLLVLVVQAESTPYICAKCEEQFNIEAALVNHMIERHDVDLQIAGSLPEYSIQNGISREYVPVPHYECPFTGARFYIEAQLSACMESL